ncbi:MAG: hypothetical protein VZQ26_04850 [Methanomethylophilus sp.]|nr:hypothetical protein [Methanomethylophilus sp.]
MKISHLEGSFSEQSASLPGREVDSSRDFLRVASLAFLAASRPWKAFLALFRMICAMEGFSSRNCLSCSDTTEATAF